MLTVPAETGVTTPVEALIEALPVKLVLFHEPPVTESVSVDVVPIQALNVPPIMEGTGSTVTVAVAFVPPQGEPIT